MVDEVEIRPESAFLALFFDEAEEVEEEDDDQRDPAQDGAVGAIVKWRVDREHGWIH